MGRGEPWSALFTLLLHAIYGTVLGVLGARDERLHHVGFDALDRVVV